MALVEHTDRHSPKEHAPVAIGDFVEGDPLACQRLRHADTAAAPLNLASKIHVADLAGRRILHRWQRRRKWPWRRHIQRPWIALAERFVRPGMIVVRAKSGEAARLRRARRRG